MLVSAQALSLSNVFTVNLSQLKSYALASDLRFSPIICLLIQKLSIGKSGARKKFPFFIIILFRIHLNNYRLNVFIRSFSSENTEHFSLVHAVNIYLYGFPILLVFVYMLSQHH